MSNTDKYKNELPYWMVLSHLPKMFTSRKTELIIEFYTRKLNIIDFFTSEKDNWETIYKVSEIEKHLLDSAILELPNYAFLAEDLLNQGYKITPIISEEYSPTLKLNLKKNSPILLYTKGNINIMREQTIAIVGSRKASDVSLEFTDNVAKRASAEYKVVVSGFAKGVDKQALDSALKYNGQSIIVLPQGIATFKSGFKKYYKEIIEGNVLILSTFFPKAPWSVQLAMGRNPIIYGLASEIYVAESSEKGGTWSGVIDGLRKNRAIYVRKSDSSEKNANNILISKGGKAVNIKGLPMTYEFKDEVQSIVSEPNLNNIEEKIIDLLKSGVFPTKKIVDCLKIDWDTRKISKFLKSRQDVLTIQGKPLKFTHKDSSQTSLF